MVPGALSTVMPCLSARPERGRTWASMPAGSAMAMPLGISRRSPGANTTSASIAASRSMPALNSVA